MPDASYQKLDIASARQHLGELFDQVLTRASRVEISRRGQKAGCVLISKAELQSLERALEILSDKRNVKELCRTLSHIAATADSSRGPEVPKVLAS